MGNCFSQKRGMLEPNTHLDCFTMAASASKLQPSTQLPSDAWLQKLHWSKSSAEEKLIKSEDHIISWDFKLGSANSSFIISSKQLANMSVAFKTAFAGAKLQAARPLAKKNGRTSTNVVAMAGTKKVRFIWTMLHIVATFGPCEGTFSAGLPQI